jgi:hypothetical protein
MQSLGQSGSSSGSVGGYIDAQGNAHIVVGTVDINFGAALP